MTPLKLDSAKYGLPSGADAPVYTYQKWTASIALGHFRAVAKSFGRHVADLFAQGAKTDGADFLDKLARASAGGYLGDLMDAAADYDWMSAFKQFASDARLTRREPDGSLRLVYDARAADAEADAKASASGVEHYYNGERIDQIFRLWLALLVENSGPFARRLG